MSSVWLEFARLLGWRRWAVAAGLIAVAGWVVGDHLHSSAGSAGTSSFDVNQWDLVLDVMSSPVVVPFILVPLFIGLVGDTLMSDRRSGFAFLSLPRVASRTRWWASKVAAVVLASAVFAALLVAVLSLVGGLQLGWGWALSEYGRASPDIFSGPAAAAKLYGPPPLQEALPALGVLAEAAYTSAAIACLSSVVFALAQVYPKPWAPLVIAVPLLVGFFGVTPTTVAHPLIHLLWAFHSFAASNVAVGWDTSAAYLALEVAFAVTFGALVIRRTDI